MSSEHTYLDYNATTPLKKPVKEAMLAATEIVGNPSSVHAGGRAARNTVEEARAVLASAFGAPKQNVLFTSGGTESIVTALRVLAQPRVLTSCIEHDATLSNAPQAKQIRVLRSGIIDLNHLEELVMADASPCLLSLMLINNETGVIQPVKEAADIVHKSGGLIHVDGVQAGGRLDISLASLGIDALSLSAHKIAGPKGVGALIWRAGLNMRSQQHGYQENRLRGGTENVMGIAGFGAAARLLPEDLAHQPQLGIWRDALQQRLLSACPEAVVLGADADRVKNTLFISMPNVPSETQVMALDLANIAVSAGAACGSGTVKQSHVAAAMGYGAEVAGCVLRISFGWASKAEDVDACAVAWENLWRRKAAHRAA